MSSLVSENLIDRPPLWTGVVGCTLIVTTVAVVRMVVFPYMLEPVAYAVALAVCALWRDKRLLWVVAAAFALMTVIELSYMLPNYGRAPDQHTLSYGIVCGAAILLELAVVSLVLHWLISTRQTLEVQRRAHVRRNTQLETASRESAVLIDEVQKQRNRFEAVIRTLPIGVLVCEDPECRVVRGNPAAAAAFGVPTDANFSPLKPEHERIVRTVYRQGRPLELDDYPLIRVVRRGEQIGLEELEALFPGGRRLSLLVSCAPTYDAQGRIAGGVCAFVDITRMKALEQELERRRREAEEASDRKSRFLAAVSHDIRTPANAISLLAEIIRRSASNPAMAGDIPELARELEGSSKALVDLVTDVLDMTRFDTGKLELHETEFSIGSIMTEECQHLQNLAQEKALMFECEPPDPPIHMRADRVKMARVLGNLISNAVKFTENGGVRVSAKLLEDGRPEIAVTDTGPGIPSEQGERIFDEFYQVRNPRRDASQGAGLGLAICRRLVAAMGGEIHVESEVDRGSTFRLRLPASAVLPRMAPKPPTAAAPPAAPRENGLRGLRILLVEDHPGTRRAMALTLESHGAAVVEAEDGQAALRELVACHPHVILLDLILPDMDGVEVLRRMVTDGRPQSLRSVLVLTGDVSETRTQQVRQNGADDIIQKPIDMADLVSTLRRTATKTCGV